MNQLALNYYSRAPESSSPKIEVFSIGILWAH
jgi:hypothetical protein